MAEMDNWNGASDSLEFECKRARSRFAKSCRRLAALEGDAGCKDEALKLEQFRDGGEAEFRVAPDREMQSILQGIADQDTRVSMYYDGARRCFATTLRGIGEHGMWFDAGRFPAEDRSLLLAGAAAFVCVYGNVKIQFTAKRIADGVFGGKAAFHVDHPDGLLRIQRREFFRSEVPPAALARCLIPLRSSNPEEKLVLRSAPIEDISGGGMRLLCDEREHALLPDGIFPDCQISLPEVGILSVTIEVCNRRDYVAPDNLAYKRIGCRFVRLNQQAAILLQRQITRLQSEFLARRRRIGLHSGS